VSGGDENIAVLSPSNILIPPVFGTDYIEKTIIVNLVAMSHSLKLFHGTLVRSQWDQVEPYANF
jgi:hypothetical protein